ncbi:MAG: type I-C CRISPR-associated protein Cas7/Csd2 [Proteobacteria bacterium]|nr:type I-C CRISPR-associated protein Cas7/Csd2 [Pseudomonadota bacterium]
MAAIQNRYDFVMIFDVQDGNPNGDPDAGNAPRLDPETGQGLVSDVCIKRKIRNYITARKTDSSTGVPEPRYDIYVKEKAVLNHQHMRAYEAKGLDPKASGKEKAGQVSEARAWMCQNFFDIRMFGAVMSTEINCGQVRGPVQITFSRSVDPIAGLEQALTRMAVTTEREAEKQGGDNRTMGRKEIVPYGLYVGHGFVNPFMASDTGFSEEDLDLLWEALGNMFELDRSAARGLMAARRLIVFKHESALGNAPAHKLFDRVKVSRATDPARPARSYSDYGVTVDTEGLPAGVTVEERV